MLQVVRMANELGTVLQQAREARGLTQQQVADELNVSRPAVGQWESGDKNPSTSRLFKLAAFLNFKVDLAVKGVFEENDPPYMRQNLEIVSETLEKAPLFQYVDRIVGLVGAGEQQDRSLGEPNAKIAEDAPRAALSAQRVMPLDVAVLGVTVGGDDHDFQFNGQIVDYVRRPPGIANARKAYATFVVGTSMYPAYAEGSLVYVNPDKPPSIGDDVIIELVHEDTRGSETGEQAGDAYIKRLKKRTSTKIVLEQFNPPKEIEFDRAWVKAMHRVVPWNELLGI